MPLSSMCRYCLSVVDGSVPSAGARGVFSRCRRVEISLRVQCRSSVASRVLTLARLCCCGLARQFSPTATGQAQNHPTPQNAPPTSPLTPRYFHNDFVQVLETDVRSDKAQLHAKRIKTYALNSFAGCCLLSLVSLLFPFPLLM